MAEPAYTEPDEHGQLHLKLAAEAQTFFVDGPDAEGVYRLVPVEPWESLPEEIRRVVEVGMAHPERWIRRDRHTQAL